MKKRTLILSVLLTACLTVGGTAYAEEAAAEPSTETTAVTEKAAETASDTIAANPDRPEYQASEYVTLGDYKGLTVTKETSEITEEMIDDAIAGKLRAADLLQKVTEGTVARNDIVNIDYTGKLDGAEFEGGSASNYDLEIGSNSFIRGFETGLIGAAVGDTKDLQLKFPENYGSKELAGKDVVFTVTVNSIKKIPELSGEIVGQLSGGQLSDPANYRGQIKEELAAQHEADAQSQMKADLLTQVANTSEITGYPQEMVAYMEGNIRAFYEKYAELYVMSMEDFLKEYMGLTEAEFETQMKKTAEQNLQQELYLLAIAEAEKLEITDEEFAAGCEAFASEYGYPSAEQLKADYGADTIRISMMQNKALDFLLENANVIDPEAETETETEK